MKKVLIILFILVLVGLYYKFNVYDNQVASIEISGFNKVTVENIEHISDKDSKYLKYNLSKNQYFVIPEMDTLKLVEKVSDPDNQSEYVKYKEEEILETYSLKLKEILVKLKNGQNKECLYQVMYNEKIIAEYKIPLLNQKLDCVQMRH